MFRLPAAPAFGQRRRGLLALGLGAALAPRSGGARECDVCAVAPTPPGQFEFEQPLAPSPAAFMAVAMKAQEFARRQGNPPYGAAVVLDGTVVGAAPNRALSGRDPTAHAEIEAIRDACRRLATPRLDGAIIYASARPCPMCEAGSHFAGIARIVYGEALNDAGPPRYEAC